MTDAPEKVIQYLLIQLNLGTLPTNYGLWPVYATQEPNQPDDCITVYDTQGLLQGRIQQTGEQVIKPGVQIRVRSTSKATARKKVEDIRDALNESVYKVTVVLSTSRRYLVHALSQRSDILALGKSRDNSDRYLFTVNYTVTLEQL
jgi:hypothetical protein